ncbi:MAG: hypothetical protein ACI3Y2_01060 [Candidatus Egerieousia sp.]
MKRFSKIGLNVIGGLAVIIMSFAYFVPADAKAGNRSNDRVNEGETLIAAAYNYAFASRKLNFTTSLKGNSGESKSGGFFISDGKKGYLKINGGAEFYYTPELVTMYSPESNEMVIQPRKKKSKGDVSNPFSILDLDSRSVNVSLPTKEVVGGKELCYVTVTPVAKKGSAFSEAKIYVSGWNGAGSKVAVRKIVMISKSGAVYETVIVSASSPAPALLENSVVDISKYPNAKVTDLR